MMYHEFIEKSQFTENYISYAEYTDYIEPIYMRADQIPTKEAFIELLNDTFEMMVYPVVEKAIKTSTLDMKLDLINGGSELRERVSKVDYEARKLAYQYMTLMLSI